MLKISHLSYLDRIKLLMMAMMTTGHLAWAFVPTDTILSQCLHFFARSTVVLACFLVVEGFYLSRNVVNYAKRLFGFGLIAQIPFIMMSVGLWRIFYEPAMIIAMGNVLLTLGLCLLSLMAIKACQNSDNDAIKVSYGFLIIAMILIAYVFHLDWGYAAILWTIGIYYKRIIGFMVVTAILVILAMITDNPFFDSTFLGQFMDYGIILAIPVMIWYDKAKDKSPTNYRLPRTFFYWYYVIHALIVGLAVQFTPYATDEYGLVMDSNGEPKKVIISE